jgi:hypothetical protein
MFLVYSWYTGMYLCEGPLVTKLVHETVSEAAEQYSIKLINHFVKGTVTF